MYLRFSGNQLTHDFDVRSWHSLGETTDDDDGRHSVTLSGDLSTLLTVKSLCESRQNHHRRT